MPMDINGTLVTAAAPSAPDPGSTFVPANPVPSLQGYQTGPQATFVASVSHADNIGSAFTGLPAGAANAAANIDTLGAVATLSADALAGTIPGSEVSRFLGQQQPLKFIAQNTLQVGLPPNAVDVNEPTPFIIPNTNALGYQGYSASLGDWIAVAVAAAALGQIGVGVLGSGQTTGAAVSVASGLAGIGVSGAFSRVGSDLMQGTNTQGYYDMIHGQPSGTPYP